MEVLSGLQPKQSGALSQVRYKHTMCCPALHCTTLLISFYCTFILKPTGDRCPEYFLLHINLIIHHPPLTTHLLLHHDTSTPPGAAIDRAGNAFAVGSGNLGNVGRNSTVFYSPLSSAYTTWTSVSPNCKSSWKLRCYVVEWNGMEWNGMENLFVVVLRNLIS